MNKCELAQHDIYSTEVQMKTFCLIMITNGKNVILFDTGTPYRKLQ
jgi:hypothetical protein